MNNLVLIGMPGAGKSTAGTVLAKILRMSFIDTDNVMEERSGRALQDIIDTDGPDTFRAIEEETILSLHSDNSVIATGGSVVFSDHSMQHLKQQGIVVYFRISFEEMEKRLNDIRTRGIVLSRGETLRDMYDERIPLYEKYADFVVDCSDMDIEAVVGKVITGLQMRGLHQS